MAADLVAIEGGEHDVEDHEVEGRLVEVEQCLAPVRRGRHPEARLGQAESGDLADRRVILDEEHALVHQRSRG